MHIDQKVTFVVSDLQGNLFSGIKFKKAENNAAFYFYSMFTLF